MFDVEDLEDGGKTVWKGTVCLMCLCKKLLEALALCNYSNCIKTPDPYPVRPHPACCRYSLAHANGSRRFPVGFLWSDNDAKPLGPNVWCETVPAISYCV